MNTEIKLARIPNGSSPFYVVKVGDDFRTLDMPIEDFYDAYFSSSEIKTGEIVKLPAKLLPPVEPTKIVCVGLNYKAHAEEQGKSLPPEPLIFLKPTTALIGHGDIVVLPPQSELIHHEAELAIVIGRKAKNVAVEKVDDYIFGYTCANDVSARDIQRKEGRYTRGKGFDTFCPLGPFVIDRASFDPAENKIALSVNGEERQACALNDFIFDVPTVVSFISKVMTLNVGDVILTGTPAGVAPMLDGDDVEIAISNIGTLKHHVQRQV